MSIPEPPGTPDPWQPRGDSVPPPPPPPPPPPSGYQPGYAYPPAAAPASGTNGRAIAVMVLGILSLLMICGYGIGVIPAIIALALAPGAKREIAASGGAQTGTGFVKAGVVCSWVTVGLTAVGIIGVIALVALGATADTSIVDTSDVVSSGVGLVGLLVSLPFMRPTLLHPALLRPTASPEEN